VEAGQLDRPWLAQVKNTGILSDCLLESCAVICVFIPCYYLPIVPLIVGFHHERVVETREKPPVESDCFGLHDKQYGTSKITLSRF
jgi:hypothetical protein